MRARKDFTQSIKTIGLIARIASTYSYPTAFPLGRVGVKEKTMKPQKIYNEVSRITDLAIDGHNRGQLSETEARSMLRDADELAKVPLLIKQAKKGFAKVESVMTGRQENYVLMNDYLNGRYEGKVQKGMI